VRRLADHETMTLLTGRKVATGDGPGPLMIADAVKPVALAGIMGGADSMTTEGTNTVLLEAAHFDPVNIRRTVRKVDLGLEAQLTASSYRFERGTDPNDMIEMAFSRAMQLIHELAGGSPAQAYVDDYREKRDRPVVKISAQRTSSYLGRPIDADTIRESLEKLSMTCSDDMEVSVPTWRVDVNDPVVLIEDVARMVGYDSVPTQPQPARPTRGGRSSMDRLRDHVADVLSGLGFFECVNPSLESPAMSGWLGDQVGDAIALQNPLTEDMTVLRRSLLSALMRVCDLNVRRGADTLRYFEIDRVFAADDHVIEGAPVAQPWHVAAVVGGRVRRMDWRGDNDHSTVDFFHARGVLEDLLEAARCGNDQLVACDVGPFLPGSAAAIMTSGDRRIGAIGELDMTQGGWDKLPFPVFGIEIDLTALSDAAVAAPRYEALSRTPAVNRDLAVVVRNDVAYADLVNTMREQAGATLQSIRLVDEYVGKPVPEGHRSLAFHLVFRDPQRTLTAEEVTATVENVVARLSDQFGAQLRA